jgi:uncharacterized cupin superfamily protein
MKPPILNLADVALRPLPPNRAPPGEKAERFAPRQGEVSARIGGKLLGYGVTALAPGKRAFPLHNHRVNEEMFLVLDGRGEVRIGPDTFPIRQGDVIACPPGGPETAHQIINTGDSELRFLGVSTNLSPEIVEYPDSRKIGVRVWSDDESAYSLRVNLRDGHDVDYWEGE